MMLTNWFQPSIQECVSAMADNCKCLYPFPRLRSTDVFKGLNSFIEPCYAIYDIHTPDLDRAAAELKETIAISEDTQLVVCCRQKRIERIKLQDVANRELVRDE